MSSATYGIGRQGMQNVVYMSNYEYSLKLVNDSYRLNSKQHCREVLVLNLYFVLLINQRACQWQRRSSIYKMSVIVYISAAFAVTKSFAYLG